MENNNNEQAVRKAGLSRKTNETDITLSLAVDGSGIAELETDVPFLNHMLDLFTKHGQFDLSLEGRGILILTTTIRWRISVSVWDRRSARHWVTKRHQALCECVHSHG